MALILTGKTKCSICEVVIQESDDIVATTSFIADRNDPLWRFSDSAMHRHCFMAWEYRTTFVKKYNETCGFITAGNSTYRHMEDDGNISTRQK